MLTPIRSAKNSQVNSVVLAAAIFMLFSSPSWGQADSEYLTAMDNVSGNRQQVDTAQEEHFAASETSIEFEGLLSVKFPEEFAIYKKLDAARKTEVVTVFESTVGKAEKMRLIKAINKIGLISDAGGWNY